MTLRDGSLLAGLLAGLGLLRFATPPGAATVVAKASSSSTWLNPKRNGAYRNSSSQPFSCLPA